MWSVPRSQLSGSLILIMRKEEWRLLALQQIYPCLFTNMNRARANAGFVKAGSL